MSSPNDPNSTAKPAGPNEPENVREETTATAAVPPIIDPDAFERFEGFRETTLALFTDATANATLRAMVKLIYSLSLEYSSHWPDEPEGYIRHHCRAAVADLRHLQGHLAMLNELPGHSEEEARISALCGRLSPRVKKIADALEKALIPSPEDE